MLRYLITAGLLLSIINYAYRKEDSHTIELDGGASQTVVFTATRAAPDTHPAEISGAGFVFTIAAANNRDGDGGGNKPAPNSPWD